MSHPRFCRALDYVCVLLAVVALLLSLPAEMGAQAAFEWRVQLEANKVAPSTVTATNDCQRTHSFRIEPDHLDYMRLLGEATFSVPAKSQHVVPVEFDTRNIKPGQYQAVITVRCLSCKSEPTCREDHKDLRVFLTVTPGAADWTSVHLDLKGTIAGNPALRWANVQLDQKRH